MELDISFGKHRADTNWKTEYLTWEEFVDRLRKVRRTKETMSQYDRMNNAQKGRIKDGPAFVGGLIRGGRRKKENIDSRSLFTLDADHATEDFLFDCELALGGAAYAVYSTHSHRPQKPKYRLIAPASRKMSADEYAAASRKLAERIGMHYFDKTTFDVHRLMYLPSCSSDAEPILEVYAGDPVDVDTLLGEYEDWTDPLQWPRHPGDVAGNRNPGTKMEDPREKHGIVGEFCRAFTISEAIAAFLSDKYEPVPDRSDRYTLIGASSFGGLVIYDDDTFAYSFHESDPISGREVNAFDLVRLHKFGHLDEDVSEDTEVTKRPSYMAMATWAESIDAVKELRQAETTATIQSEFGDMEAEEETPVDLDKVKVPFGFKVIQGKLFEVKETKAGISHVPVCDNLLVITGRHINLTTGTQGLSVAWKTKDGIRIVEGSRSDFMDSKKIINKADYGLPVHSGNARALANYLSRFEHENEDIIRTDRVSNQLGWVNGGFLLGEKFIGEGEIKFFPADVGDGQTVRGFHTHGEAAATYGVLERIKAYPAVMMAVYAALAGPLVGLVGEPSFIFELAGGTSKGKTTALRIAASLYGCPDENKPGFFKHWNMTRVYVERYAATMNNLPLFLDDTKKGDPKMIPGVIYQFCSGQGRGRGSLRGSQIGATWNTVMLTTGEQKLTSFSKDGGAVGRILSLEGSPFGSTDLGTNELVDELNGVVSENYGHLAEPWIRFLMGVDRGDVRRQITEAQTAYKRLASGYGEVALRLSRLMSVLEVTGRLFDECFFLDLYDEEAMRREWLRILTGSAEIDRPLEALESVLSWVASHHRQFLKGDEREHYGPILSGRIKEDELIIISDELDEFLRSRGYEPVSIVKAWKDKGWLNTEDGRLKKSSRIGPIRNKAYCINLEVIGPIVDLAKDFSEFDGEE